MNLICLIISAILFGLAAFGHSVVFTLQTVPLGLFFLVLSMLVGPVTAFAATRRA